MVAIKKILILTILIGTISIALTFLFNDQNISVLITKETINGTALTWYKFNWVAYKENLLTQINNVTELALPIPTRSWSNEGTLDAIVNNLALMLDYIILILNVLLYPIKIGGYFVNFILAILGLNVSQGSSLEWLGTLANRMIALTIPYV